MDLQSLNSALTTFGTRFFSVASANPEAEISACPGWSMKELVAMSEMCMPQLKALFSPIRSNAPRTFLTVLQMAMYLIGLKVIFIIF